MSYNVLAPSYARPKFYIYCQEHLDTPIRSSRIINTALIINADIQLYQEIEVELYESLLKGDVDGFFATKEAREEGLAILVNTNKWEVLGRGKISLFEDFPQHMIYVELKHRETNHRMVVSNVHLLGDPSKQDIQLKQIKCAVSYTISKPADQYIIAGDFNADPYSQPYDFMAECGFVNLIKESLGRDLETTFKTDKIDRSIDYIWSLHNNYDLVGAKSESKSIDEPIPNATSGSDHIPISVTITLKSNK